MRPLNDVLENVAFEKFGCRRLSYLLAVAISCGSQCRCCAIQPDLPAVNDGLPFSVRG